MRSLFANLLRKLRLPDTVQSAAPLAQGGVSLHALAAANPPMAEHFIWRHEVWPDGVHGALVQFGCGPNPLNGFVNFDFLPNGRDVFAFNMLNIWPDTRTEMAAIYSEDVLEHFFLNEQFYILSSMNCSLRPGGIVRALMPNLQTLWNYQQVFDLDQLLRRGDFLASTLGCRSGADAFNMGMRMGGHRWLHVPDSFARLARACGFRCHNSRCDTSLDPRMNGINIRQEPFSFAVDLELERPIKRLVVMPEAVEGADLIETVAKGQHLWRAGARATITYRLKPVPTTNVTCLNVRSANLAQFKEHNFASIQFAPASGGGTFHVDRTLHSTPYMNTASGDDLRRLLDHPWLDEVVFRPGAAGDYFTTGPLELFVLTESANGLP